jgi:hypothetical protein
MSDNGLIFSMVAAIGLIGLILSPPPPPPEDRYATLNHGIFCDGNGPVVRGLWFSGVRVEVNSPSGLFYNTFDGRPGHGAGRVTISCTELGG